MTAQLLAPVIPSSAVQASRQRARSAAGRPLPLARNGGVKGSNESLNALARLLNAELANEQSIVA